MASSTEAPAPAEKYSANEVRTSFIGARDAFLQKADTITDVNNPANKKLVEQASVLRKSLNPDSRGFDFDLNKEPSEWKKKVETHDDSGNTYFVKEGIPVDGILSFLESQIADTTLPPEDIAKYKKWQETLEATSRLASEIKLEERGLDPNNVNPGLVKQARTRLEAHERYLDDKRKSTNPDDKTRMEEDWKKAEGDMSERKELWFAAEEKTEEIEKIDPEDLAGDDSKKVLEDLIAKKRKHPKNRTPRKAAAQPTGDKDGEQLEPAAAGSGTTLPPADAGDKDGEQLEPAAAGSGTTLPPADAGDKDGEQLEPAAAGSGTTLPPADAGDKDGEQLEPAAADSTPAAREIGEVLVDQGFDPKNSNSPDRTVDDMLNQQGLKPEGETEAVVDFQPEPNTGRDDDWFRGDFIPTENGGGDEDGPVIMSEPQQAQTQRQSGAVPAPVPSTPPNNPDGRGDSGENVSVESPARIQIPVQEEQPEREATDEENNAAWMEFVNEAKPQAPSKKSSKPNQPANLPPKKDGPPSIEVTGPITNANLEQYKKMKLNQARVTGMSDDLQNEIDLIDSLITNEKGGDLTPYTEGQGKQGGHYGLFYPKETSNRAQKENERFGIMPLTDEVISVTKKAKKEPKKQYRTTGVYRVLTTEGKTVDIDAKTLKRDINHQWIQPEGVSKDAWDLVKDRLDLIQGIPGLQEALQRPVPPDLAIKIRQMRNETATILKQLDDHEPTIGKIHERGMSPSSEIVDVGPEREAPLPQPEIVIKPEYPPVKPTTKEEEKALQYILGKLEGRTGEMMVDLENPIRSLPITSAELQALRVQLLAQAGEAPNEPLTTYLPNGVRGQVQRLDVAIRRLTANEKQDGTKTPYSVPENIAQQVYTMRDEAERQKAEQASVETAPLELPTQEPPVKRILTRPGDENGPKKSEKVIEIETVPDGQVPLEDKLHLTQVREMSQAEVAAFDASFRAPEQSDEQPAAGAEEVQPQIQRITLDMDRPPLDRGELLSISSLESRPIAPPPELPNNPVDTANAPQLGGDSAFEESGQATLVSEHVNAPVVLPAPTEADQPLSENTQLESALPVEVPAVAESAIETPRNIYPTNKKGENIGVDGSKTMMIEQNDGELFVFDDAVVLVKSNGKSGKYRGSGDSRGTIRINNGDVVLNTNSQVYVESQSRGTYASVAGKNIAIGGIVRVSSPDAIVVTSSDISGSIVIEGSQSRQEKVNMLDAVHFRLPPAVFSLNVLVSEKNALNNYAVKAGGGIVGENKGRPTVTFVAENGNHEQADVTFELRIFTDDNSIQESRLVMTGVKRKASAPVPAPDSLPVPPPDEPTFPENNGELIETAAQAIEAPGEDSTFRIVELNNEQMDHPISPEPWILMENGPSGQLIVDHTADVTNVENNQGEVVLVSGATVFLNAQEGPDSSTEESVHGVKTTTIGIDDDTGQRGIVLVTPEGIHGTIAALSRDKHDVAQAHYTIHGITSIDEFFNENDGNTLRIDKLRDARGVRVENTLRITVNNANGKRLVAVFELQVDKKPPMVMTGVEMEKVNKDEKIRMELNELKQISVNRGEVHMRIGGDLSVGKNEGLIYAPLSSSVFVEENGDNPRGVVTIGTQSCGTVIDNGGSILVHKSGDVYVNSQQKESASIRLPLLASSENRGGRLITPYTLPVTGHIYLEKDSSTHIFRNEESIDTVENHHFRLPEALPNLSAVLENNELKDESIILSYGGVVVDAKKGIVTFPAENKADGADHKIVTVTFELRDVPNREGASSRMLVMTHIEEAANTPGLSRDIIDATLGTDTPQAVESTLNIDGPFPDVQTEERNELSNVMEKLDEKSQEPAPQEKPVAQPRDEKERELYNDALKRSWYFYDNAAELIKLGNADLAIQLYEQSLKEKPLPFVSYLLADTLTKQGRTDEALDVLRECADQSKFESTSGYDSVLRMLQELKQTDLVKKLISTVISQANEVHPLNHAGLVARGYESNDLAVEAFNKALSMKPGLPSSTAYLAQTLMAVGKNEEAKVLLSTCLDMKRDNESDFDGFDEVAKTLDRLGDREGTKKADIIYIEHARGIWGSMNCVSTGRRLQRSGDTALARKAFEKALALEPGYENAIKGLAELNS